MVEPISKRIELIMSKFNFNKNSFSKAIGITNNVTIGYIINEQREPSYQVLVKILQTFDSINADWLLTGKGEMFVDPNNEGIEKANTPRLNKEIAVVTEPKLTNNAPPTLGKTAPPTAPATGNLGMPKVVAINENNEDLVSLVSAKAAAGYLNGYADTEYVENLPTIRLPNLKGGTHRAFENKGHSMLPTLHNGSISVGRWVESLDDIKDRRIYIIVSKHDGIVIKRVLNRIEEAGKVILLSDNSNKVEYPNYTIDVSDILEVWYLRGGFIFDFREPSELYSRFNDMESKMTIMQEQLQKLL